MRRGGRQLPALDELDTGGVEVCPVIHGREAYEAQRLREQRQLEPVPEPEEDPQDVILFQKKNLNHIV